MLQLAPTHVQIISTKADPRSMLPQLGWAMAHPRLIGLIWFLPEVGQVARTCAAAKVSRASQRLAKSTSKRRGTAVHMEPDASGYWKTTCPSKGTLSASMGGYVPKGQKVHVATPGLPLQNYQPLGTSAKPVSLCRIVGP